MLEKRVLERDTLRMLLAEIKRYQIDEKAEATDEVVLTLLTRWSNSEKTLLNNSQRVVGMT